MSYRLELNLWWMLLAALWVYNITLFPSSPLICIPIIGTLHALISGTTIHKK